MVQLSAPTVDEAEVVPQPPVAIGRDHVDSGAVTEESIEDLKLGDGEDSPAPSGFSDTPPPPAASDADPGAPSWQSAGSARSKRFALMVAVGLASVISLGILVAVLIRGWESKPVAQTQETNAVSDSLTETEDAAEPTEDSESSDSAPTMAVPTDASDPAMADTDSGDPLPSEEPTTEPAVTGDSAADPPSTAPGLPPMDLLPKNPLLPDNPLLPSNPLEVPKPAGDKEDGLPEESTMRELPSGLANLVPTIRLEREQLTPNAPPPPTIDQIEIDRAADANVDPDVLLKPQETVNMRQALSSRFWPNVTNDAGYPLNDLLLLLSHFAGVPIEVEWVSFDIVGQPINAPVKLPSRPLSVEEILTGVCKLVNAEFEVQERSIVVRPSQETFETVIGEALRFEDLGEEGASAAAVARTLLGLAPEDSVELEIPEELGRKQLAVLVCEAIRTARGVPTKMPPEALARWAGDYESQLLAWEPVRDGISGPTLVQPATFGSLVRQTARRNSVTCFIRWQDAALSRISPTEKRMPHRGDDVSAEEMLNELLSPGRLTARVVDKDHWWVGAQASFDRFPVVVWFNERQEPKKRFERITALLKSAGGDSSMGGVAMDPTSGWCVAVLPRFLLRQVPRALGEELAAGE
ncbi:MAG: hypothetical protein AAFX06_07480 [Planctomycetota bacterium]